MINRPAFLVTQPLIVNYALTAKSAILAAVTNTG
jgi:hypothetical protein